MVSRCHLEHIGSPKSLIFSTDKLIVSNQNWFFESTRCNQAVSSKFYRNEKVAGWYFEVAIHSKGIMQIGMLLMLFLFYKMLMLDETFETFENNQILRQTKK